MSEKIYIGNFSKGLKLDRLPFNIDNDNFATMYNFYSWRGRAKRKRGTLFLGQLQRQMQSAASPNNWQVGAIMSLNGSGNGSANLISTFSLESTASIAPGSINFSDGTNTYTEPATPNGTLSGSPAGSGTINYATGAATISGGAASGTVVGKFSYFPTLPVLGLEDFVPSTASSLYPVLLAFDDTYAYQLNQTTSSVNFYDISYYKYSNNPVIWSGQDYQQFWTTNYSQAFWATNNVPGLHILNGTYVSGSGTTTVTFNFTSGGNPFTTLVVGDRLWFNEWSSSGVTVNGIVGQVTNISGASSGNYVVTFTSNKTVSGTGIAQMLTNRISGQDGIRWYDGDPTNATGLPTGTNLGWVNFAPPLTASTVSIDNQTTALYYLVGALAILPYKDRLLFFSPWIQSSSGNPIQLIDTVLWSWVGTPYYYSITPTGETNNGSAYYVDQTGYGGYISAGISSPIVTINNNEDVLLIGFSSRQTRFVYTGNDISPFLFFSINSELGSSATFSGITLDRGGLTIGTYGLALTTQQQTLRVDLDIPDSIFQIQALNNGVKRVNAARDFYREWIYFSYPVNSSSWKFPTQTFLFNYRDNTWAILYENFTVHGSYRKSMHYTWATLPFKTWAQWREPWNAGSTSAQFPSIIAGNPEGYVLIKGQGTGEGVCASIAAITNSTGNTQITSYNHCMNVGDYIYIQNCLGTTSINMTIGKVIQVVDANNFVVDISFPPGTYLGLGQYSRLSVPLLQTKQFPTYWDQGRKVILREQKYLMDYTANAQVSVNIYLSQDPDDIWNSGSVVPSTDPLPQNNSLIYSQILYTCPESTNIGLTPANTNLQMPTAEGQFQIWHRLNTSLIGDTVQIGLTLSDAQMRNLTYATSEVTLHAIQLTVDPGPLLA